MNPEVSFWRRLVGAVLVSIAVARCGSSPAGPGPSGSPPPVVGAVSPASGPTTGGTTIRITGANFAAGASVSIGGVPATEVVVESATALTAKAGAHTAGSTDVVVTVGGQSAMLAAGFRYEAAVVSQPPAVQSIAVRGARPNQPGDFADLGEEVTVTAVVRDDDTPADKLTFTWTADAGTFTGTGATVKWRAPATATTPTQARLTLAVQDDGGNRVTAAATVSVHDSVKEVGDLARLFLLDFSDSSKSPSFVVRNFSTSARCIKERDGEFDDVTKNRNFYRIDSSNIQSAVVNFQFASRPCSYPNPSPNGDACAAVPSTWNSTCLVTNVECKAGDKPRTDGVDFVTAVFEDSRWQLCASNFKGAPGTIARPKFIR